ncbi:hypothetical protein HJC04_14000 [Rhizobium sp. NLR8a]|nr:hypothetical protein [Rhizobium sp. NLR8a]
MKIRPNLFRESTASVRRAIELQIRATPQLPGTNIAEFGSTSNCIFNVSLTQLDDAFLSGGATVF